MDSTLPSQTDPTEPHRVPTSRTSPAIGDYIEAIATNTCTDPAMAVTSMLSAISYSMAGVYRVYGKKDHSEPITLYSIVISPPASMKSPVVSLIKKPFDEFVETYNESHTSDYYYNEAKRSLLQSKMKTASRTYSCFE